ncbi:MAG: GspE/PulE family protein [Rhodothermaceae bacterium]|nr:GspE/PulE family protein [Rhodothermaceae bacterium]
MSQVYEAQKIKERESLKEALWRILVDLNGVDKDAIYEEAARIYAFPIADVEGKLDAKFVRSVLETLTEENRDLLLSLHLVPYESETEDMSGGVKLAFITHDPMRAEVRRVMKELKLDRFDLYYAPQSDVISIINEAFPRKNEYMERLTEDPMAFDLGMSYEDADLIDEDALEAEISRSSLINLFEATLVEAVRQGASDVHIYPNAKKKVEIHFRVDGRLTLWHTEHKVHPEALLAVIKDNAMNVDRFERDAAQDGYIQRWIDDVLIRFRVSVLPIANISHEIRSESIVIRVLDDRKVIRDLRKLGLLDEAMEKFEQAISQPHGMVILTGPTGSGKSTTLVAALHQVITGEVNVLTVEDPVEYIIPGVRQIKLNYKLELENALRAILRHDPDVVMVGEMRDRKTAELAIKLANTGHLTFSTLHTNDAPSAISRLYKMGIEPFLIAYAINLIVAQRLIRLLCTNCKQPELDPDPIMLEKLGFTKEEISSNTIYVPGKDPQCPVCKGVGYKGRRAVSEALYFSREVRHMIVEADKMIDEGAIKDQAVKEGMMTLRDSAREIVKLGQTSVREMIRVVTTEG